MTLLPPTKHKLLSALVIAGCVAMTIPFALSLNAYVKGTAGPIPFGPLIFTALIIGLWRLTEWARKTVTFLTVVCAIIVPIGVVNPFNVLDMKTAPLLLSLVLQVYLPAIAALIYVYGLSRFKDQFRKKIW